MSVKLPNGVTVPTAPDKFEYSKHLKRLGLSIGMVPKVDTREQAKQLVQQLKQDPAFEGDFGWLIYVKNEDTMFFHDGNKLREN